ncbi:MAG: hypothetical protein AAF512_02045 [Pseudomonadota bacterium]
MDALLLETGDCLLLESGDKLLLETGDEFTLTEYNKWLGDSQAQRIMLLIINNSGATKYISSGEYQTEPTDSLPNTMFSPRAPANFSPSVRMRVPFLTEEPHGNLELSTLEIINLDGRFDDWRNSIFVDYESTMLLGDRRWPYSRFLVRPFKFVIDDIEYGDIIKIDLRDKLGELDGPLQESLITSGPNLDEPIPIAYGQCENVPLSLIDPDSSGGEYQANDGEIQAYDDVYDNGVALSNPAGYTSTLSTGKIIKVARPVGSMTADIQGAKVSGSYITKAADIAQDMVTTNGPFNTDDIDSASFSQLNTDAAQTLGFFAGEPINRREAMAMVLSSVGAVYYLNQDNKLAVGRITDPSTLTSVLGFGGEGEPQIIDISVKQIRLPQWRTKLGYQRNWHTQSGDDLAGSITDANAPDKDRVAFLGKEYRVTSYPASPTPSAGHIDPPLRKTLIHSKADADTEAQRIDGILGVPRAYIDITVGSASAFQLLPLNCITVTNSRFGLSAGQKIQILELEFSLLNNEEAARIRGWF